MSVLIKGMEMPKHVAVNGEKDTAYRCIILAHPDSTVELVIDVNTKQELKERETIPNNITPEATIIELNRCKVNGFMPVDVDRRGRAIERAKAALRKQVPMKVGYDDSMSPGLPAVRCGRCTELVEKEYSYCPACGQALDWSDKK